MKLAWSLVLLCILTASAVEAAAPTAHANGVAEASFNSSKGYADPFNEVEVDAVFRTPGGKELRIPGFWAGGQTWKLRYASPEVGTHKFRTICSDANNAQLHDVKGEVVVTAYTGDNPLYVHGPIRVAADKRHFEHADGTPFFWLGDTWWMGLCNRLRFPEDVKTLSANRKNKRFNVVQIVAGLYPDMHPFDPRGANEAGYPWEKEYARINPAYFDAADKRLQYLADEGFSACIVGAWGYFMPWMGVKKMEQHWRYLIARYGAMPVVWCAAGEANLNWYLAKPFPVDDRKQVTDWTEVMRYIRKTDGFQRPLTIHPTGLGRLSARHATDDVALLDFDMLQTPHGERAAVAPTVVTMRESYGDKPLMPVINGEAAYERLGDTLGTDWTRMMFWLCMTNGAAGHTYGANGIWQVNRKGQPHGPSPHHAPGSVGYGKIPWDEAMNLGGSTQVGLGKKLFSEFAWQKFEPHVAWAQWASDPKINVPLGDWVWYPEGDAAKDAPAVPRFFRTTFELPANVKIETALLRATADDRMTAWLNGRELGTHANHQALQDFDLAGKLNLGGRNVLAVRAENVAAAVPANPAGFIGGLSIIMSDGKRFDVKSGPDWRSETEGRAGWQEPAFDDANWKPARVAARYGEGPWGKFSESNDPTFVPYATGIAGDVRIVYVPEAKPVLIKQLENDSQYSAFYFDPVTGDRTEAPPFSRDANGEWRVAPPTWLHDWVLVMKRK
jgi:hypothetical protein